MINSYPRRGEIYWINLDPTIGSEINKTRPALIVSNNFGNQASNNVIIAPITSTSSKGKSFEVEIQIGSKLCKILLNQIRTVDKIRIKQLIGVLEDELMLKVDQALRISLDL